MKRANLFLLTFILLSSVPSLYAQEVIWQRTLGGDNDDILHTAIQTNNGTIALGGKSRSGISGIKTVPTNGSDDYWIVELDVQGNIIYQVDVGGVADDHLKVVRQTNEGGLICGGFSRSGISGDKTEACFGIFDFWIVKLDTTGNITWQRTLGGSDSEELMSMEPTNDGGFICAGVSNSLISGNKTDDTHGGYDYWVVRLDSLGNILWQRSYGGTDEEWLYSVKPTPDNGFICGGISKSPISGDKTEGTLGSYDFWILKLDSAGNIQWQNTIGGSDYDALASLELTADGGYIVGGSSTSSISGDKTQNCIGMWDYWIMMLDGTGQIVWQNTIGGNLSDQLYSIRQNNDGGYTCGGFSLSGLTGNKTDICKGLPDYWMLGLDSVGRVLWQNTIGGSEDDRMTCVLQLSDEGFIGAGWSESDISWDKTENSYGKIDYWITMISNRNNLITGTIFVDVNSNGIQDSTEIAIPNRMIKENTTGRFTFSDQNGYYKLTVLDSGNYEVIPPAVPYYNVAPASHLSAFIGIFEVDSLNDFAFAPAGMFPDLCVNLIPLGLFRSGMNVHYVINYVNNGTTVISPAITFYPDSNLTFSTSTPTPGFIYPDSITWNFGPLNPLQGGMILIRAQLAAGLPQGTIVNSGALVAPLIGDVNPVCNQSWMEAITVASSDPNFISVDRSTLFDYELSSPPFLEYTIHFQNTGNDTAFVVNIINPIDASLFSISNLEWIAASHPMAMNFNYQSSSIQFLFDNILLPDSNIDEAGSHGFIKYRIRPVNNLVAGDTIFNQAHIYFDFNSPVATNIVFTEVITPTYINEQEKSKILVYPNPARDHITVSGSGLTGKSISIGLYDLYGRCIKKLFSGRLYGDVWNSEVDLSDFSSGVYFMKVEGAGSETLKIIKL